MLENLTQIFMQNPIAQTVGLFALIINIFAVIFFKNKKFIYGIILTSFFWWIHFLLMWLYSGAIINFIDIVKNYASVKYKKNKKIMWIFMFLYLIIWFFLYTDFKSLLPVLASFIWIYSFFLLKWVKLKIWYFFVVVCWFIYWFLWQSIGWATADWILMISSIYWIFKYINEKIDKKCEKKKKCDKSKINYLKKKYK